MEDWHHLKELYGHARLSSEVVRLRSLDPRTLAFCCTYFELNKEEFRCYSKNPSSSPTPAASAYDRLESPIQAGGYTMLGLPDIAAMKLSEVCNRGSKKDFFDIVELLDHYGLPELFDFYKRKFKSHDTFHVLRSLTYFDDAEDEPDPITLKGQTWEDVKLRIGEAVRE
jgi:hypothetical protein